MNREELASYLDSVRITGEVATPRENNLDHMRRFLDGNEHLEFGVRTTRPWTFDEVFSLMHEKVGTSADPSHTTGQDTIDAAKCVAALDRFADRLGRSVRAGERILFATGHPGGLLPVHAALASAAAQAGAEVMEIPHGIRFREGDVRQVQGVLAWHQHGNLMHTHYPQPMRLVLESLAAAGRPGPELVVADHGWAGEAAAAGVPALGFADCNDPGLFVSEAEGQLEVAVPLDDNVPPVLYVPLTEYVLDRAGFAGAPALR
ncbi:taurine ABC transporter ATPase [Arthrobacter crusticola]|uniref:Taurine ABC transporter ATPase n=1 Tax=Arthrobacter crusticola TaxID=2547960 RepID=A0A4R5TU81_9MICC|nr:phosphatase [Arthrobacter crusticola]TDK24593.1 taurine ABC transporter ATPase [Arthrobacter crusticola]